MTIRCLSVLPHLSVLDAHVPSFLSFYLHLTYLASVIHPRRRPFCRRCCGPVQAALSSSLFWSACSSGAGTASAPHGGRGRCGGREGSDLGLLSSPHGSAAHVGNAGSCSEAASALAPAILTWVGYLTPNPEVPSACLLIIHPFSLTSSARSGSRNLLMGPSAWKIPDLAAAVLTADGSEEKEGGVCWGVDV